MRAALLLHDVGHGPFSHACEAVLGVRHEARTAELLALPDVARARSKRSRSTATTCSALILGDPESRYPALRELVSGPNLDADRMDYLLRDAYFTGVASGRYDAEQLVASLRLFERDGRIVLGIDARGVVALESFVMARYMMFASVYFHHTTRLFERMLQDVLRELWPDPRALDPIDEFLRWDDFRVLNELRDRQSEAARALRERIRVYALAAEFNAERDLRAYEACERALRDALRRGKRLGRRAVAGAAPASARRSGSGTRSGWEPAAASGRRARSLRSHRETHGKGVLAQTLRPAKQAVDRRRSAPHLRRGHR